MRLNQSGVSLIEMLLASLLIGGLALGTMQLAKMHQESQKGIAGSGDLTQAFIAFRENVSNKEACEINFKTKNIGDTVTTLKNGKGDTFINVGDKFANGTYQLDGIRISLHDTVSSRTTISFDYSLVDGSARSKNSRKSFSLYSKVTGTEITECLDALDNLVDGVRAKLCKDMDPLHAGDCNQNYQHLLAEVRREFCTGHPFWNTMQVPGSVNL